MMTPEQLLKSRYRVTEEYPDSPYTIGEILDRDWACYPNDDETKPAIWRISQFPKIFKKLDWWEDRKKGDMPEYVKSILTNEVYRVEEHFVGSMPLYRYHQGRVGSYQYCIPVTEEEYEKYLETHKPLNV